MYEPLEDATHAGEFATLDRMTGALNPSLEYVAALYESFMADEEEPDTSRTPAGSERNRSLIAYSMTAARISEDLWTRDIERVQ